MSRSSLNQRLWSEIYNKRINDLTMEKDALAKACRAVLLFHGASEWTPDVRSEWKELTGADEATTRTLCDAVRRALASIQP